MGRSRIADDLALHLRDRILTGEIPGGAQLAEQTVASQYDVARPTARTAMAMLHDDGLLTLHPHLPATVSLIPAEALPEILRLLEVTEDVSLDILRAGDPDLRPLRAALAESPHAFLDEMVEIAGSQRLIRVHRRSTYELLLAQVTLEPELSSGYEAAADELFQTLLVQDGIGAAAALAAVQRRRRESLAVTGTLASK